MNGLVFEALAARIQHRDRSGLYHSALTGTSTAPGELRVGVLPPEPGTWQMFLLTRIGRHYLTTPFTLRAPMIQSVALARSVAPRRLA